jgi:sugar lactone lactonase YvrE
MAPLELGEGARWLPDGPVQVDLLAGRLLAHRDGGVATLLDLGVPLGAVAPLTGGGLVAVAGTGVRILAGASLVEQHAVDTGEDPADVRVNDATTDERGRLWFGLMRYDQGDGGGSVWRLDPDLTLTRVLTGVTVPNGPVVDEARQVLYVADSARGVIFRHALDRTGDLGPPETFASVHDASPDGMALDSDGGLWSAQWGGSRLHRYAPDGELTEVVPLPADQPTSLALDPAGGPALVTTAAQGLTSPGPFDGRSLWVDLGVSGRAAQPFGASPSA